MFGERKHSMCGKLAQFGKHGQGKLRCTRETFYFPAPKAGIIRGIIYGDIKDIKVIYFC